MNGFRPYFSSAEGIVMGQWNVSLRVERAKKQKRQSPMNESPHFQTLYYGFYARYKLLSPTHPTTEIKRSRS